MNESKTPKSKEHMNGVAHQENMCSLISFDLGLLTLHISSPLARSSHSCLQDNEAKVKLFICTFLQSAVNRYFDMFQLSSNVKWQFLVDVNVWPILPWNSPSWRKPSVEASAAALSTMMSQYLSTVTFYTQSISCGIAIIFLISAQLQFCFLVLPVFYWLTLCEAF